MPTGDRNSANGGHSIANPKLQAPVAHRRQARERSHGTRPDEVSVGRTRIWCFVRCLPRPTGSRPRRYCRHERHSAVVRVRVIRIGVQRLSLNFGPSTASRRASAQHRQARAGSRVCRRDSETAIESRRRKTSPTRRSPSVRGPGPREVARIGLGRPSPCLVLAHTAVVTDREPFARRIERSGAIGEGRRSRTSSGPAVGVERVTVPVPPSGFAM